MGAFQSKRSVEITSGGKVATTGSSDEAVVDKSMKSIVDDANQAKPNGNIEVVTNGASVEPKKVEEVAEQDKETETVLEESAINEDVSADISDTTITDKSTLEEGSGKKDKKKKIKKKLSLRSFSFMRKSRGGSSSTEKESEDKNVTENGSNEEVLEEVSATSNKEPETVVEDAEAKEEQVQSDAKCDNENQEKNENVEKVVVNGDGEVVSEIEGIVDEIVSKTASTPVDNENEHNGVAELVDGIKETKIED